MGGPRILLSFLAMIPQFLNSKFDFMVAVFVLLLCLSLAKCGITYIKERLIIKFASKLDLSLYQDLIDPLQSLFPDTSLLTKRFAEAAKSVQRVHQSVAILVGGILSDGLMVVIMLICLYLYFPGLVLQEVVVMGVLLLLTNRQLPLMLVNNDSRGALSFLRLSLAGPDGRLEPNQVFSESIDENAALARKSLMLSTSANKLNFRFELTTSVNLIMVLAYGISKLRASSVSYQEFIFGIILCYAIIAMAAKICNQLFLVAQGAQLLGQHCRGRNR
jgi:hypothetical protein